MNYGELTAVISSLAVVIANSIPDDDELNLLSVVLTQLGDTLATISLQRELNKKQYSHFEQWEYYFLPGNVYKTNYIT